MKVDIASTFQVHTKHFRGTDSVIEVEWGDGKHSFLLIKLFSGMRYLEEPLSGVAIDLEYFTWYALVPVHNKEGWYTLNTPASYRVLMQRPHKNFVITAASN